MTSPQQLNEEHQSFTFSNIRTFACWLKVMVLKHAGALRRITSSWSIVRFDSLHPAQAHSKSSLSEKRCYIHLEEIEFVPKR